MKPDAVFLRGCGVLHGEILEIPRYGLLNAHYGELPKYRGVYATEWAILHGDRPVITMHFVTQGVDTGGILATRPVPIRPGATLASLRDESSRVGGELLADVLDDLEKGSATPQRQTACEGVQYFSMHPRIYAVAEQRLRRLVGQ
jgi:methionyl-tRNA formyltransferase